MRIAARILLRPPGVRIGGWLRGCIRGTVTRFGSGLSACIVVRVVRQWAGRANRPAARGNNRGEREQPGAHAPISSQQVRDRKPGRSYLGGADAEGGRVTVMSGGLPRSRATLRRGIGGILRGPADVAGVGTASSEPHRQDGATKQPIATAIISMCAGRNMHCA